MGNSNNQGMTRQLKMAAARAVATHQIDDSVLESVAEQLNTLPHMDLARRVDLTRQGVAVDYFVEPPTRDDVGNLIRDLLGGPLSVGGLDVFPWGIPAPNLFQVRVSSR